MISARQWIVLAGVTLGSIRVSPAQTLTTTAAALTFQYQIGATALPAAQTVQVRSTPVGLNFTAAVTGAAFNGAWLLTSTSSGKAPLTVSLLVNPTGLPAGSYSGTVTFTGTVGAPPPAVAVTVTLLVSSAAPTIAASPGTLNFSYTTGGPIPSVSLASLFILSSNGGALSATLAVTGAPWLKILPTGNITLAGLLNSITVTVDPTGLAPRVYTATIRISAPSSANKTVNVAVTLTVNAAVPKASLTWPAGLIQGAAQGVVTLSGESFYTNSTVAATGFTAAATVTLTDTITTITETFHIPVYPAAMSVIRVMLASPLPSGVVSSAYSQNLAVAGGTGPYTWSVLSGALPAGLSITGSAITGTPTAAGTYGFALAVTDSAVPDPATAYMPMRMTIYPAAAANLRITVAAAPLAAGVVGTAYGPIALTAASAAGPLTWTAALLPAGLTLSAAGSLSGTPSTEGLSGALAATRVSDTAMLVTTPAIFLAQAGIVRMTVTTPAPGGGVSNEGQLLVFGPEPQVGAVMNSASFRQGTLAPGEVITIFGLGLGPAALTLFDPTTPPIPTSLPAVAPSTSVTIGGVAAPLLYVTTTQLGAIVPYTVAGPTAQVVVTNGALVSQTFTLAVAPTDPGIYTLDSSGMGQGAILNFNAATLDYTINTQANAAAKGSTVVMYITGAGATTSAVSNMLIPAAPPVTSTLPPSVQIGGQPATVVSAQAPPGSVPGLLQLNVTVPATAPVGKTVPVLITVGGVDSQIGVTMAVK